MAEARQIHGGYLRRKLRPEQPKLHVPPWRSEPGHAGDAQGIWSVQLPYGISVSGSGIYSRGFPEKQTVSVGRDTVTLTQITQVLVVAPAGTTSLPSVTLFDLSLKKSFKTATGFKVEPVCSLFNLGNINTVVNRSTQLGPTYERRHRDCARSADQVRFEREFLVAPTTSRSSVAAERDLAVCVTAAVRLKATRTRAKRMTMNKLLITAALCTAFWISAAAQLLPPNQ